MYIDIEATIIIWQPSFDRHVSFFNFFPLNKGLISLSTYLNLCGL